MQSLYPRLVLVHAPIHASWLNQIEIYFSIVQRKVLTPNDFTDLNAARSAFKKFFGAKLPGAGYDFYDPPIPVNIEGSLFFDMTHATGARPGPQSLKSRMPVIWEVHPLTSIKLG